MDLQTKRTERQEKLITNMAYKLARGTHGDIIAVGKRKKKIKRLTYIASAVFAFLISSVVIYFHLPKQIKFDPEQFIESQASRNPINKLSADYQERKISADEYAVYLKDILIRYDSLPKAYRIDIPFVQASEVYDSLSSLWPSINVLTRKKLQDLLPNLESRRQEYRYQKSARTD